MCPMNLTEEQKQAYYNAKSCYICNKPFVDPKTKKSETIII